MNRFFKSLFYRQPDLCGVVRRVDVCRRSDVWRNGMRHAVGRLFVFSGRLSAAVYQFPLSFPVRSDIQPFARCHHEVAQMLLGRDDLVFGRLRMAAIVGLDNRDAGTRWLCVFPRCRYGADRFVFRRFAAAGHGVGANACHCHRFFEKPTQKRLIFVLPHLFWRNPLRFQTTPLLINHPSNLIRKSSSNHAFRTPYSFRCGNVV